jgi:Spy/CpxP family protein refolding chaperone
MNNKWLKVLLAASLAFNLAFVSTAIYRHFRAPGKTSHDKPPLEQDLKLGEKQEGEIKIIIKQFRINLLKYKQEILDKRIAIIEAMSDTEFNPGEIEGKTGELNQLENQLNLMFVDTLLQINALLEPEQRLNLLYKLSKNWFFINKDKREREYSRQDRSARSQRRNP